MKNIKCLSEYDPLDGSPGGFGHLYHKIGINKIIAGELREVGGEGQYASHDDKCHKCGRKASSHKIVFHKEFHPRQYYHSKSGAY